MTIVDSTLTGNSAGSNGGVLAIEGNGHVVTTIIRSTLRANTAGEAGGGVCIERNPDKLYLSASTIDQNTATTQGGQEITGGSLILFGPPNTFSVTAGAVAPFAILKACGWGTVGGTPNTVQTSLVNINTVPYPSDCTVCQSPGKYNDGIIDTDKPGKYITTCKTCPHGKVPLGAIGTRGVCVKGCVPGKFGPRVPVGATALTCSTCGAGTYAAAYGQTACTKCTSGKHSATTGAARASTCSGIECVVGKYGGAGSTRAEDASCSECVAGKYTATAGQSECSKCAAGTHSASAGATGACSGAVCETGTFGPLGQTGSSGATCTKCTEGKVAPSAGMESCTPCASGMFQDETRQLVCKSTCN